MGLELPDRMQVLLSDATRYTKAILQECLREAKKGCLAVFLERWGRSVG